MRPRLSSPARLRHHAYAVLAVGAVATAAAITTAAPAPALATADRYAAPNGTGTTCLKAAPCSLVEAINNASGGHAQVIIAPGIYGSAKAPITDSLSDTGGDLVIHGVAGKPMPVIYSAAPSEGLVSNHQSTISNLAMIYSGTGNGIESEGPIVDHVSVVASADGARGCSVYPVLSDSLCVTTGKNAQSYRISSSGGPATYTMRGVTAIALGANSDAVSFTGGLDATLSLNATNVIAHGTHADLFAGTTAANATVSINPVNSAYKTTPPDTGPGTASINASDTNIATMPKFVNVTRLNFAERPGSPTIDAGAMDSQSETKDLIGNPRTLGTAPDIGAYEFLSHPRVSALRGVKVHAHAAKATVTIDTSGLATKVRLIAKHGKHQVKAAKQKLSAANPSAVLHFTVKGLDRTTSYQLRVVAKNRGGSTASKKKRVTTH